MYCHKLTGKDFDEMFELGIFYDRYCKQERKYIVTHINYCNKGVLQNASVKPLNLFMGI